MDPADELRRRNWDKGIRPGIHTELCEYHGKTPFCTSCGARLRPMNLLEWLAEVWFQTKRSFR